MGLDMYLENDKNEEVAYWRKANAIHWWFVENVQNGVDECQKSEVTIEKLKELYALCVKVLENKLLAEELLPTKSGFFFGSYEYDDWYFEKIEYTKNVLEKIIEKESDEKYYYQSSW